MQGLACLRMEHMTHLLQVGKGAGAVFCLGPCVVHAAILSAAHSALVVQFPSMPEALPGALWRLPRLRSLSLAGSCCHPSKLKLLAAVCGGSVTHLDIGTGGSRFGAGSRWGSPPGSPRSSACVAPWAAAAGPQAQPAQPPGPAYRRLTSLHERDLCEAAQSFRQLQSFSAAGSSLPLRVVTAFLEAAPAGRLTRVDLQACCLDAEPVAAAAAHSAQPPWQQQLFFSSGARRALTFDAYPAVTGTSASRLQQLHAQADSWQRPATAGELQKTGRQTSLGWVLSGRVCCPLGGPRQQRWRVPKVAPLAGGRELQSLHRARGGSYSCLPLQGALPRRCAGRAPPWPACAWTAPAG